MIRKVESTLTTTPVLEGAGVKLRRVFGYPRKGWLDPFLMLDHFGSDDPADYMAGFPWHPHRGIETVTYMLAGDVEHEDSMGNKGRISSGDIQWMTAGSGILHQEMPQKYDGTLNGFQLWVNLPAAHKMMDPRYQDIPRHLIPEFDWKGIRIRLAAGTFGDYTGPVKDIIVKPVFMDITIPPGIQHTIEIDPKHTAFTYVFEGNACFDQTMKQPVKSGTLAKLVNGDEIFIASDQVATRFLLIAGKPLNEPIAWRGPIVMNTKEELYQAFTDYEEGNFIKAKGTRLKAQGSKK
jgi:redox-sensitive bicupin YhaK (pirin superfamily)